MVQDMVVREQRRFLPLFATETITEKIIPQCSGPPMSTLLRSAKETHSVRTFYAIDVDGDYDLRK